MKNKIVENLSFVVIAATLILIAVFNKNGQAMLYIGAVGASIYGVLAGINRERYGAVSLGAGLSLLVTMLLYTNKILDKVDSTTFFVACSMAVVCLVTYVFMFINEKAISKKYSLEVEATVVDLEKNPNTKKDYYSPIYVYTVDGRECRVGLPYFINKNIPNIGDKTKIYVDPNDMLDVYFKRDLLNKIRYWGTGLVLIIVCIFIIISLFV